MAIISAPRLLIEGALTGAGADPMVALIGGYHVAFATGAVLAVISAALGFMWLPTTIARSAIAPVSAQ